MIFKNDFNGHRTSPWSHCAFATSAGRQPRGKNLKTPRKKMKNQFFYRNTTASSFCVCCSMELPFAQKKGKKTSQKVCQTTSLWRHNLFETLNFQPIHATDLEFAPESLNTVAIAFCAEKAKLFEFHFGDVLVLSTTWDDQFCTTRAYDDKCLIMSSYLWSAGSNLIPR